MAAFNVYLSYPVQGGYSDFIDITEDCLQESIGSIKEVLESNEYDVGKITFSSINLVLRNEHSAYSDAFNPNSIFPVKRDRSKIRVEFDINSDTNACGWAYCGETFLSAPVVVFEGLLEESTAKFDVLSQTITFTILGLDSIISKVLTPYSDLVLGDDANTLVYKILNQSQITEFLTVDLLNINCNYNFVADAIVTLENKTCLESLQEILKLANSVLFVRESVIYIQQRINAPTGSYIFYGPSSDEGIENILQLSDYSSGINRTWNVWTWADTNLKLSFSDSIDKYGERKKEIESELITDNGKRTLVLDSYINEFGFPKIELNLTAPIYTPIAELGFLDMVNIDYPSDALPVIDSLSSRYGQAVYGNGRYNTTINSLFISVSQQWKILNKTINVKQQTITFKLREV